MAKITLPEKREVLGVGIHPLTLAECAAVIRNWIREQYMWEEITGDRGDGEGFGQRPAALHQVVTLNAEMLYRAQYDTSFRDLLNQADLVVPDGHGVVWAGRRLGCPFPERVTGIDLIYSLVSYAAREKWRIFLLGGVSGVAEAAALKLRQKYPGLHVAGTEHGYFSETEIVPVLRKIRATRPDLLLVALGSPRQEFFIWVHRRELGALVAIGVGGSLDVLAGRLRRAPVFFQRLHLEWLYRVLQEPSRWRRALVLPRFAWKVLRAPRRRARKRPSQTGA
ncbi:MAG: WecB/TagA/CpsF family glycosyltransferase [Bacillota bacterium]|jgi:N-acetylglucosaminyldiphosphoundecaprenol N-acetyl-beta-D-mannosaminyltransferase|nr:WecB/TagA/CpsF family glycosyltransferase [Bacillota bacterium]